tara:strand:+ start:1051 stop:1278 length:228 start_codon:yes stop_codon:yes gene_type:complete
MNLLKDNFRAAVTCVTIMCFTFLIYSDKVTFSQAIASITAVASGYFFNKKQEAEKLADKESRRADEAERKNKEKV